MVALYGAALPTARVALRRNVLFDAVFVGKYPISVGKYSVFVDKSFVFLSKFSVLLTNILFVGKPSVFKALTC